jgi:hypothetical protein
MAAMEASWYLDNLLAEQPGEEPVGSLGQWD